MDTTHLAAFAEASLPTLLSLLTVGDPDDRADAACTLGDRLRTGEVDHLDPTACAALAHSLDDVSPIVRFEAAIALAEAHDARAMGVLLAAMGQRVHRLDAIRALGTLGDGHAILPLRQLMGRMLLPWADRMQAAAALCALGDTHGAAYLASKSRSRKSAERAFALHFVAEARHPDALTILQHVLLCPDDPLRDVAVRALGVLRDPSAIPVLQRIQPETSGELRDDIAAALATLAGEGSHAVAMPTVLVRNPQP